MAGGTDFGIDLQSALQLSLVVVAERTGEGPMPLPRLLDRIGRQRRLRGLRLGILGDGDRGREAAQDHGGKKACNELLHFSLPLATQAWTGTASLPFCFSSTASVIEFGMRLGVSTRPRTGMTTRKKR